jgi:hypothetical protein
MTTAARRFAPQPTIAPAPRRDLYAGIHKALRLFMTETLATVGRTDATDAGEVATSIAQVRRLLDAMASHLDIENRFVHPAIEAAIPGATYAIAAEHIEHERAIARLAERADAVEAATGETVAPALASLYRQLALFVAENLAHMHVEETEHNAVLWAMYPDGELEAIERAIVASIAPDKMAVYLRWMIPAMNAAERATFLGGMQQSAPRAAFQGVLAMAKPLLGAREWGKLAAAIGPFAHAA